MVCDKLLGQIVACLKHKLRFPNPFLLRFSLIVIEILALTSVFVMSVCILLIKLF